MKDSNKLHRRRSITLWTLCVLVMLMQLSMFGYVGYKKYRVVEKEDWTIQTTMPGYTLAKSEPASGIYLGGYVLQNPAIAFSMKTFNERTGRQHASFFKYVGYGKEFPTKWVEQVKSTGAVPHIAFEPNNGLAEVKDDEYLQKFADEANKAGVPIFMRFASEMNGTWTNYSGDPEQYKQTWKMVHRIFSERAPNIIMVWAVLSLPEETIESYYPGDDYVDWVGVNVYSVKYHNDSRLHEADFEDPLDLLNFVYNRFSREKPIMVSEYGATHYTVTDDLTDNAFAAEKIKRFYGELPDKYPRIKAVFYFDVNNTTEYNEKRRINDYSITTEQEVLAAYSSAISRPEYLTEVEPVQTQGAEAEQRFTYRGLIYKEAGTLYADKRFFTDVLGLKLQAEGSSEKLVSGKAAVEVKASHKRIWAGYNYFNYIPRYRSVDALPIVETLEPLGYRIEVNGTDIIVEPGA
nr:glycosyl hydrolase [Paenibacillus oenotherae]